MKTRTDKLIAKGAKEPLAGLLDQGNTHLGLATKYATQLASRGWSSADTSMLDAAVKSLDTDVARQTEAHADAGSSTALEHAAVTAAKAFIRQLRLLVPRVLRDRTDLTMANFSAGESLQRSGAKIVAYLATIRPHVATLDSDLTPAFGGKSPLAELDAAHDALVAAGSTQEVARATSPESTATLNEGKGRVLEMIEDLNRAGKASFDGEAVLAAIWNKDLLLRARKHAAATAPAAAAPPPPSPPAPSAAGGSPTKS